MGSPDDAVLIRRHGRKESLQEKVSEEQTWGWAARAQPPQPPQGSLRPP